MDANASTPKPARADSSAEPSRGRRRPRRGRDGQRGRGMDSSALAFRPATVAPDTNVSASETARQTPTQRAVRGRGRGDGRGRGGRLAEPRTVNGRTFGGQLTREDPNSSSLSTAASSLQAHASVFTPVHQHPQDLNHTPANHGSTRTPRQQKRRASKSQAPDIATRTHEDIDNGHYECAICTSDVQRNSKVWSCHTCWTVFHLTCIKKWSSNEGSAFNQEQPQGGDLAPPRRWRCPGCNLPKDVLPTSYNCWCEKETQPRALAGIPPHSCGQTCGKDRVRKCPHPCQMTCHAGPCPPCTHMGPKKYCFCGKHETTKRCSETDYSSGWSCGDLCGGMMSCGEHPCTRPCHDGACGACDVRLPARCYCGQMEKHILCSDRIEQINSSRSHKIDGSEPFMETWTGMFNCGSTCNREFDCAHHFCERTCHWQDAQPSHCPRSPDVVTHCSCGKTPLTELLSVERQSCQDPIPSCEQPCNKSMSCGHLCPRVCHIGDCPPCLQTVTIDCRCGRTTSSSMCHQGKVERPQCRRVCRITLNCGRHMCEEHCCSGERKAIERQSSRKKQRPLGSASRSGDDAFEAEHICTRQCGRLLKCGSHHCEELCHKGPCGSCREAIFDEIGCACGRTILHPPLPCGTQPPPCRYSCERLKACGHQQVPHSCHQDDDSCPKCPFLVEKRCMCGKKSLKNQQCWLRDVSCGTICGKKLRCGVHYCRKPCHRTGDCEDARGQQCLQPCGKLKAICGHPDEAPCHAPFSCKEDKQCQNKMFITCDCQAEKQEVKCGASKSSEGNMSKALACTDECARLERNRRLAVALNIDQSTHVDGLDHIPYSTETLNLYSQHVNWAQTQEREFRVFAAADDERRLRFTPMKPPQRTFLHSLAEDFGLDSESVDPEPHRHVLVWKTPRFVSAPNKTLADALRLRQAAQRSVTASTNVSDNEGAPAKSKLLTFDPFNSFRITKPRFGLTIEEVRTEVNTVLHPIASFTFDIEFLPSEEVVLKAMTRSLSAPEVDRMLQTLRAPLATAIATKGYGSVQLCTTDSYLNITRYESDGAGGDGWSTVAAKKAAPKSALQSGGLGASNAFAALGGGSGGGKVTFSKKAIVQTKPKTMPEDVAEDWEAAELAEEEKEKSAHGSEGEGSDAAATDEESSGQTTVRRGRDEESLTVSSEKRDWAEEMELSL